MSYKLSIFGTATVVAGFATYWFFKVRKTWVKVGTVSKLYVYPLKSSSPTEVEKVYCTKYGAAASESSGFDRSFMIVDENNKDIPIVKNTQPLLIKVTVHENGLTLKYKEKQPITVQQPYSLKKAVVCQFSRKEVLGYDCGDEVNEWLSDVFGKSCKLMYSPPNNSEIFYKRTLLTSKIGWVASFQEDAPYNILSDASVSFLNDHLDTCVSERNFRPNIFVTGCKAFAEDSWKTVKINNVEFNHIMRTGRCIFTTIDPDTGIRSKVFEPLKTLRRVRKPTDEEKNTDSDSPRFGNHITTKMEGIISCGDDIYCLM